MSLQQPIQLPVQTFTSTDTDAPQLTPAGAAGEIKTILKACLSTGYGTTAPATGWEMQFEDVNKAVFRSTDPRTTGFCFRIDNNAAKGGQITCYETMSDIDTGINQWSDNAAGFVYANTSPSALHWKCFVTAAAVLFISESLYNGYVYQTGFWFGDSMTTKDNDEGNCWVAHQVLQGIGAPTNIGGFATTGGLHRRVARSYSGALGGVQVANKGLYTSSTSIDVFSGHHGYPFYLTESNAVRLLPSFAVSNKREAISGRSEIIAGRPFYVTSLGRADGGYVYFIPTDYWLL